MAHVDPNEIADISTSIHSMTTLCRSIQFQDEAVLQSSHFYWNASCGLAGIPYAPEDITDSVVLRWLAIHHTEQLSEIDHCVKDTAQRMVSYQSAITQAVSRYGLAVPERFANYHHCAVDWIQRFVDRWRRSWSELLNQLYPFVDWFDPRKAFYDPGWYGGPAVSPDYSWDIIARTAHNAPEPLWRSLVEPPDYLFRRAKDSEPIELDHLLREVNCLKRWITDDPNNAALQMIESALPPVDLASLVSTLRERGELLIKWMGDYGRRTGKRCSKDAICYENGQEVSWVRTAWKAAYDAGLLDVDKRPNGGTQLTALGWQVYEFLEERNKTSSRAEIAQCVT